jgi:trehalose 6-phosphate synthase/phosphatase
MTWLRNQVPNRFLFTSCYAVLPINNATGSVHSANTSPKWKTIMEVGDESWKDSAKLVMDIYTQRTHGTYIEQKGNALIWQFRDADPEFGFLQSKELEEHLTEIMSPYPVQVPTF